MKNALWQWFFVTLFEEKLQRCFLCDVTASWRFSLRCINHRGGIAAFVTTNRYSQIDQWRFLSENGRSCCRIVTWRRASCQHWNQSFATKVISTAQCLVVAEYQSSQWQRVFLRWKSLTQKAWTRSLPFDQGEWSTIFFFFSKCFFLLRC